MKRQATAVIVVAIVISTGAAASSVYGPRGEFSTFLSTLKYDPSRNCRKPSKPYRGGDKYAVDAYGDDARRYVDCMKSAATADMDYAARVVADGYKEKLSEFTDEVKRDY